MLGGSTINSILIDEWRYTRCHSANNRSNFPNHKHQCSHAWTLNIVLWLGKTSGFWKIDFVYWCEQNIHIAQCWSLQMTLNWWLMSWLRKTGQTLRHWGRICWVCSGGRHSSILNSASIAIIIIIIQIKNSKHIENISKGKKCMLNQIKDSLKTFTIFHRLVENVEHRGDVERACRTEAEVFRTGVQFTPVQTRSTAADRRERQSPTADGFCNSEIFKWNWGLEFLVQYWSEHI